MSFKIKTGQTIYESILSVDTNNYPISASTLTTELYKNGQLYTDTQIYVSLTDPINAVFCASWSAASFGSFQLYAKNDVTNLLYMSDVYLVVSDEEADMTIYAGL